jgi:hypothetical protein
MMGHKIRVGSMWRGGIGGRGAVGGCIERWGAGAGAAAARVSGGGGGTGGRRRPGGGTRGEGGGRYVSD